LGFSIDECRKLLSLYDDNERSSAEVKSLANKHLHEIEAKMLELQSMHDTLSTLVKSCAGDNRPDCPILQDLAQQPAR
jgi:DNA-binding transcriptional MerR regulator